MATELEIKTERIRRLLEAEKLGGLLINGQHNFAWATGGGSSAINVATDNGCCFLFFRADGRRFLIANNIEMQRLLAEQVSGDDFEPVEMAWTDEKNGPFVVETARSLAPAGSALASDLFLGGDLRPVEGLIARCRYELTPPEIERYRALGRDAGEALASVFAKVAPGETEAGIARKVNDALAARGIESVVTLVGADERIAAYRHPRPSANVWRKLLLLVTCARRHGLIANLSRIACVGEIPAELRRRTEACAEVFATFLQETKPGAVASGIFAKASEKYASLGFAEEIGLHHQGGATGYKGRDWVAHPNCGETVVANQAFAWNPSITGTKAEETVIVGADGGIEFLTVSPGFPSVEASGYDAPGILQL